MRAAFVCCLLLVLALEGRAAEPPRIALVSGSLEYDSDASLTAYGKALEKAFVVTIVPMLRKSDTDIPGLEKLASCDAAIFFTRRLKPNEEQLAAVKAYLDSGKPVLGLRTASHGFQNFLEMDKLIFGGDYAGHHKVGPTCAVSLDAGAADHPILKGVKPFTSLGSLYKNTAPAKDVTILLRGEADGKTAPLAWVRLRKLDDRRTQRVFYTSLGHAKDFEIEAFTRLLTQALQWSLVDGLPVRPAAPMAAP